MPEKPIISLITPGRRAYGETWSKVSIIPNADTGEYDVEREDTEAPADGQPIIVPALGNLSIEMVDFILEEQRKEAEYRAKNPEAKQRKEDFDKRINRLFMQFMEEKLKQFKGQSVSGPGGWTQRERIHDTRSNGS